MKNKKYLLNLIIILLVTTLTIYYLISKNLLTKEIVKSVSLVNYLAVFVVYLFSVIIYAFVDYLCVKKSLYNFTFLNALSDVVFGRLGSDITPFKSGHFPLRVYSYMSNGFSFYQGLSGVTRTQIVVSFSSVVNYLILFFILLVNKTSVTIEGVNVGLYLVVGVGALFHVGSIVLSMLLAFVKPFQKFCITLISKIRFRKNKDKREEFIGEQIVKYQVYKEQVMLLLREFYKYILPMLTYILYLYLITSFIYLSYLLLAREVFSFDGFIRFYLLSLCLTYITNVIPIPGGSGSSEGLFVLLFPLLIKEELLAGTLILWRVSCYYLPVLFGGVFFLVVSLIKRRKNLIKS